MCGICGFVGSRKEKKAIIGAMMEAIEHRGPIPTALTIVKKRR